MSDTTRKDELLEGMSDLKTKDNTISLFDPFFLYYEVQQEIEELLTRKPSDLTGDVANYYKHFLDTHCERALNRMTLKAVPFSGEWLNTTRPLDFDSDLKNRIYVIDFFTLCCINCIHILPNLREVENAHKDNKHFTVIGINCPKFSHEKSIESLKEALLKYDIKHPVLHDAEFKVWNEYGIFCWPTVFVVGFDHSILFALVGESQIDKLPFLCEHILNFYSSKFTDYPVPELPLSEISEIQEADEEASIVDTSLLFPGAISTDGKNLAVADTGHHRILLMSKDLKILKTIGSGVRGNKNGNFSESMFDSPNGSTWFGGKLYVADTGNHCIREIDFECEIVQTLVGQDDVTEKFQSPWDVCMGPVFGSNLLHLSVLYIAVAGSHQVWAMDLDPNASKTCAPFAGTGKEENRGNQYNKMRAAFAQPSGIAYSYRSPDEIYVADSESSSIKSIDVNNGVVKKIVGGSADPLDLFKFGDRDGKRFLCQLQHPMGVAVLKNKLIVISDTYNHKVKIIDVVTEQCLTFNVDADLREPSGMCFMDAQFNNELCLDKTLFICDTNNHRIVPFKIDDTMFPNEPAKDFALQVPYVPRACLNKESKFHSDLELPLDYSGVINCRFRWNLEENIKINVEGSKCTFEHEGDGLFKVEYLFPGGAFESVTVITGRDVKPTLRLTSNRNHLLDKSSKKLKSIVRIQTHVSCCDEKRGVCSFFDATFEFFVKFTKVGITIVELLLDRQLE